MLKGKHGLKKQAMRINLDVSVEEFGLITAGLSCLMGSLGDISEVVNVSEAQVLKLIGKFSKIRTHQ